ncbi:MAG TPA: hypothetical protein VEL74_13440 [Thermoanaerobaculia bacterium]|nr:hypothetical protein [Thermoanaerobaculia bacterium]
MKKPILIAAAVLVSTLPLSADETIRTLNERYAAGDVKSLYLDVPVGEVVVQGGGASQVTVEVELECDSDRSRCAELAKAVRLQGGKKGDRLQVELDNWPKGNGQGLQANVRVTMPRDLALQTDLGVGELRISGIEQDVNADVGVGEVSVTMPESAVRSVNLDSGVGDATLRTSEKRIQGSGMVGKELKWNKGTGSADVRVDCGVGEIGVSLQ